MVVVRILKRRDAASVAIAIAVALILYALLSTVSDPLASTLSSRNPKPVTEWHNQYLYPLVLAAIELIALEILGWIYVAAHSIMKK